MGKHSNVALVDGICPVCGESLATHPECKGCWILFGPGHLEHPYRDGLCKTCYNARAKGIPPEGEKWRLKHTSAICSLIMTAGSRERVNGKFFSAIYEMCRDSEQGVR